MSMLVVITCLSSSAAWVRYSPSSRGCPAPRRSTARSGWSGGTDPQPRDLPRDVEHHHRVGAIVERSAAQIPAVEVRADHHDLVGTGAAADLADDVERSIGGTAGRRSSTAVRVSGGAARSSRSARCAASRSITHPGDRDSRAQLHVVAVEQIVGPRAHVHHAGRARGQARARSAPTPRTRGTARRCPAAPSCSTSTQAPLRRRAEPGESAASRRGLHPPAGRGAPPRGVAAENGSAATRGGEAQRPPCTVAVAERSSQRPGIVNGSVRASTPAA